MQVTVPNSVIWGKPYITNFSKSTATGNGSSKITNYYRPYGNAFEQGAERRYLQMTINFSLMRDCTIHT